MKREEIEKMAKEYFDSLCINQKSYLYPTKGFIAGFEASKELLTKELEDKDRQLKEAVIVIKNLSNTLYDLMSHCEEQNFIDSEDKTDGVIEYEKVMSETRDFLSTLNNNNNG